VLYKMNIEKFLLRDNNNLDFIRIVCASMVIISHSYVINPCGHEDFLRRLTGFTYSGELAVKLFFFISGILVTDSLIRKQSIKGFLISRIFRMMPGLIFVLLITAFIVGPLTSNLNVVNYFRNSATYSYVVKNMFFVSTYNLPGVFAKNASSIVNGSLWSLRYEARCYFVLLAIFIICKYTIKKYTLVYSIFILLIFTDALFKLNLLTKDTNSGGYNLLPMSFALGSLLAVYKKYIVIDYKVLLLFILLTVIFWRTGFNEILFVTTVCLSVIVAAENKYIRMIKIKHDISYGVYLWGFLVSQTIFYVMGNQNIYLFMLYSLFISYIMGFLSFIIVERKFMLYGRNINKGL